MKICPRCEAELKDSVIRCRRCGQTVRGDEALETVPVSGASASARDAMASTTTSSVWGGAAVSGPSSATAAHPAAPARPVASRPSVAPPNSPMVDRTPRRALPTKRALGFDPLMLLAGLVAAAAGAFAYLAIKEPWVHLTITREAAEGEPALVATMSLRGKAAFVGTTGMWLAIVLGVLGVVWFVYGFQRGWTMPGLVNPAIGLLVTGAGLLAAMLSAMVWFVWQDSMVLRAKAAGLSSEAMTKLLDWQPSPLVQIQRLSGLMTFGGMMVLGLLASCAGSYSYRRRES